MKKKQLTDWEETLDAMRQQWEEVDDAIAMMPDAFLSEALDNPHLSKLDKERVKARQRQGGTTC